MKKLFSILFALLILLSGMHFSVATHYCGGKVAATRLSFSGTEATCGMISDRSHHSDETQISRYCCDDEVAVYEINTDYSPSSSNVKEITRGMFHEFQIPGGFSIHSSLPLLINPPNASPPGWYLASAVSMAAICVFRI
jgi:hypothetical protein